MPSHVAPVAFCDHWRLPAAEGWLSFPRAELQPTVMRTASFNTVFSQQKDSQRQQMSTAFPGDVVFNFLRLE